MDRHSVSVNRQPPPKVDEAASVRAFLISAILTGGPLLNTDNQFSEALKPTGYVSISVVRDGNEIYHYEDHNAITETGVNFMMDQISDSPDTAPHNSSD